MLLRILGSGTIIPSAARRATSLLVEWAGERVLLDCGPGALEAIEESGISYRDVRRIFISHYHPDHTLGLGRFLAAANNDGRYPRRDGIAIYGPPGLEDFLEGWHRLYRGTEPKGYPLEKIEVKGGIVIESDESHIGAAPVRHGGSPALAYRVEEEGTSFVYTGDTGYDERLIELAAKAGLLVAECSFPDGHPAEGHLTPSLVGRVAAEAEVERVLLVHLYPAQFRDPSSVEAVERAVGRIFDGPVETARDGMEMAF